MKAIYITYILYALSIFTQSLSASLLSPISMVTQPINKKIDNWRYGKQCTNNFYNTQIHTFLKKLGIQKTVPVKQFINYNDYGFTTTTGIWINERKLQNHSQAIKLFLTAYLAADYALQQPQIKYGIQSISNAAITPVLYKYIKQYRPRMNISTTSECIIDGSISFISAHILNKLITVPLFTMNHSKNSTLKAAQLLCESGNAWVLKEVIDALEKTHAHTIFNSLIIKAKPYICSVWNKWIQHNSKLKHYMEKKAQHDAQCYNNQLNLANFTRKKHYQIHNILITAATIGLLELIRRKYPENSYHYLPQRPNNPYHHLPDASPFFRDRTIEFLGYAGIDHPEHVSIQQCTLENGVIACATDSYIHYDENQMIRTSQAWQIFTMAHEVAHYVLRHASQIHRPSQEKEQEADEYATNLLLNHGYAWALYETILLLRNHSNPDRDNGRHPSPRQCVQYMSRIWDEWAQYNTQEAQQAQSTATLNQLTTSITNLFF